MVSILYVYTEVEQPWSTVEELKKYLSTVGSQLPIIEYTVQYVRTSLHFEDPQIFVKSKRRITEKLEIIVLHMLFVGDFWCESQSRLTMQHLSCKHVNFPRHKPLVRNIANKSPLYENNAARNA